MVSFAQPKIAPEYLPNYWLEQVRESIQNNFLLILSTKKVGQNPSSSLFAQLHKDFKIVFPLLPQKSNYKIIYNACLIQTEKLAVHYQDNDFDTYMDQCQTPLNNVMKEVNTNYTIKANIKASPQAWAAPLTVTLDARASVDPSNDTIPSNNFYWYYKNTDGVDVVIGRGSVISYTFDKEGVYYVHLTARSANKSTQGILDDKETVIINVAPKIASVVVYANNKKLQEKVYTKIGTSEAQKGVIFDGSATQAKGWRQIMSHQWEIVGSAGFKFTSAEVEGRPGKMTIQLPDNGSYTVKLSLKDNENNVITESFVLAVSDPIALIRQNVPQISTTTQTTFDAGASYSINSRIRRYNWEIFDDKWERELVSQQKAITHKFSKPGSYILNLTVTDELNETNTESQILVVESTPPQAQFTITPRLDRQHPSQFILDATSSFDVDVAKKLDVLSYEWSFSNPNLVKVEHTYDNGQSLVVSFNQAGKHTITLTVKDSFGKISTLSRDIQVNSSLRPVIYVAPRASAWWSPTRFVVTSNNDILNYEWDFGDGYQEITQQPSILHTYKMSGVYNVKLTAIDKKGDKNSISTLVFVGNKDVPIGAYTVQNSRQHILRADQKCENNHAYLISRGEKFIINTLDSVNTKGQKNGLLFYFTPQNDEIYKAAQFNYSFKQVGCQKVDILVEDTVAGKSDKQTLWFYVVNDLPKLDSMSIYFTQFGNEVGIGLQQNVQSETFDPLKHDPLIVKISANNARDVDGTISQFLWYYYKTDDPTRILEMKSTPGNVPYTYFSISTKDPSLGGWNISFGVKLIDNNDGEQYSENLIGQGPTFFLPPCKAGSANCDQSMDVPIVTFSVDKTDIAVWDTIVFKTKAKTLSNRPDFETQRVVSYDFDGDGTRDLVTKALEVSHVFQQPHESITPRVQVTYRKNAVVVTGPELTVKQSLKVKLDLVTYDKTVYVRDYSLGEIRKREICFEEKKCKTVNKEEFLSYVYESHGQKQISYTLYDAYGNSATDKIDFTLKEPEQRLPIEVLSIPRATIDQGKFVIPVADGQSNKVFLNVLYADKKNCYIDLDINEDANFDGKADNDKDVLCNTPRFVQLDDYASEINARIVYEGSDGKLVGNGIIFQFTEEKATMTLEQKKEYNTIMWLAKTLPATNPDQEYIKTLLQEMADNVRMGKSQTNTIITLKAYLETTTAGYSQEQIQSLQDLIKQFDTSESIAIQWWTIVDQVRQFLLDLYAPSEIIKNRIIQSFSTIQALPEPAAQPEIVKKELSDLLKVYSENSVSVLEIQNPGNEDKIIESDIELQIKPRICEVLSFYDISFAWCSDNGLLNSTQWSDTHVMGNILKWVGIGVGILALIFVLIVVFFAIKARIQQREESNDQYVW